MGLLLLPGSSALCPLAPLGFQVLRNWGAQSAASKARRLRCMGALIARLPADRVADLVAAHGAEAPHLLRTAF